MSIPPRPASKADTLSRIDSLEGLEKLVAVVAQLRHPEQGCPWDLKQTHHSLKPYLLEEAYEAIEAIDLASQSGQSDLLKEELGDVLLQVVLHAQLAQDAGEFDIEAVGRGIADKLIRRHPHVFGDEVNVSGAEEVTANWQAIKAQEKTERGQTRPASILEGVSGHLPALSRALETSKRAVKVGFEWPDLDSLWACVMSEYDEFRAEVEQNAPHAQLEEEMGDILFATVNLARFHKIDPEVALSRATAKFTRRFQAMERMIQARYGDRPLEELKAELDFDTWDALWNQAKRETAS